MTPRERVIDLVTKINAAKEHLQQLEAELDRLLSPARTGHARGPKAKRASRGKLAARVVELLESEPGTAFAIADVAKRLGVSTLESLRKSVLRLTAQHKIHRQERGKYRAARATAQGSRKTMARSRRAAARRPA